MPCECPFPVPGPFGLEASGFMESCWHSPSVRYPASATRRKMAVRPIRESRLRKTSAKRTALLRLRKRLPPRRKKPPARPRRPPPSSAAVCPPSGGRRCPVNPGFRLRDRVPPADPRAVRSSPDGGLLAWPRGCSHHPANRSSELSRLLVLRVTEWTSV